MDRKIYSYHSHGYNGQLVDVEVDIRRGLPSFEIVGLAGMAVRESRERLKTAFYRCGLDIPADKILVNLSPAGLAKQGASYDLAIAIALLQTMGKLELDSETPVLVLGELRLSGEVVEVDGILNALADAHEKGIRTAIIPPCNMRPIEALATMNIFELGHVAELKGVLTPFIFSNEILKSQVRVRSFDEIKGQGLLKSALAIAAAGSHHSLIFGPPGVGKTMALTSLPSVWPRLCERRSLEVSRIKSLSGVKDDLWSMEAPFRMPHCSSSVQALLGGGKPIRPGEISLAHEGVLVLDEAPEFQARVLQGLREPIESRRIEIARVHDHSWFPAGATVFMSMNPCPCGNLGKEGAYCACSNLEVANYWKRIGAPLLDRMDIRLGVYRDEDGLFDLDEVAVRQRIGEAVKLQDTRWGRGERNGKIAHILSALTHEENESVARLGLKTQSYRAQAATVRLALTIANMFQRPAFGDHDLGLALRLRSMEPELAGMPICK